MCQMLTVVSVKSRYSSLSEDDTNYTGQYQSHNNLQVDPRAVRFFDLLQSRGVRMVLPAFGGSLRSETWAVAEYRVAKPPNRTPFGQMESVSGNKFEQLIANLHNKEGGVCGRLILASWGQAVKNTFPTWFASFTVFADCEANRWSIMSGETVLFGERDHGGADF